MTHRCCLLLLPLLVVACAQAAEPGLVACYTFDEEAGEVALDSSGHGLNGKIIGPTRLASPRGRALHFDGKDDYVDLGMPEGLVLKGDLTLEAWLRAERLDQRNRLIIGDTASLSVQRNYSIRFDRDGLFFEYGDGQDYVHVVSPRVPTLNEWAHLAILCESPRYYLYLNGQLVQTGDLAFPMSPTQGSRARCIGGWWAGWFQGDMDEVRVYNRALTAREVMAHAGLQPQPKLTVSPVIMYSARRLGGEVSYSGALPEQMAATLTVRQAGKELQRLPLKLTETRPGSERWSAPLALSTTAFRGGKLELRATIEGRGQGALAAGKAAVDWPAKPPVWFGSQAGVTGKPTAPFQPLSAGEIVCGRKYTPGPNGLFAQIEALRQPLLAGPMRLVSSAPVSVKRTVEYDGFAKLDCTVKPGARTLDRLVIEIPFRPEVTRYVYSWPKITSHALTADVALPFQPIVWIGDDEKGLSWLCESDQNWNLADPAKAVQVVRGEQETVLRVTLVDQPVTLPKSSFTYTFALQATPLRPPGPDVWSLHYSTCTWYGEDLDLPRKQVEGKPALRHYADKGVRTMLVGRWWTAFAYPAPLGYENEFRALVKACHDAGIKVVPYVGGFLLSELAPEAPCFKQEMTKWPLTDYALHMPGLTPQTGFITCQRSSWQDFLVDGIARLMDDYDVDGVYLDSTTIPWLCRNELHGCGYVKPDGSRAGTYPIFAIRQNLQRIYNVVKQRKPDGLVDMHVYDCMNPAALAYCTSYWNGEQLANTPFKTDGLPLDRFRTEFMGANWGVPADMLYYMLHDYRKCTGLALLHDVPVRAETLQDLDRQSQLWALHDRYPYRQARWWPYWRNGEVVKIVPEACYVSLYAHPQQGVLAYVANLSKADAEVRLRLDRTKLGLPAQCVAEDGLTGEKLPLADNAISLKLASQDWRAVWVKGQPDNAASGYLTDPRWTDPDRVSCCRRPFLRGQIILVDPQIVLCGWLP